MGVIVCFTSMVIFCEGGDGEGQEDIGHGLLWAINYKLSNLPECAAARMAMPVRRPTVYSIVIMVHIFNPNSESSLR